MAACAYREIVTHWDGALIITGRLHPHSLAAIDGIGAKFRKAEAEEDLTAMENTRTEARVSAQVSWL